MKKFNSLFVANQTKVQLPGEYGYRLVKEIHPSRQWIKIHGLDGSFQRGHINCFSNKSELEMFPALEDKYTSDQYGSVYEREDHQNVFIGKLNGETLKQFVAGYENTI